MRESHQRIAGLVREFQGRAFDAHYIAYFECFNQQRYFEAHEVLEPLWLAERGRPQELFFKGLIQFAGAFVHLQKNRRAPAIALFGLARKNLRQYPNYHEGLNLKSVLDTIDQFVEDISIAHNSSTLSCLERAPKLLLRESES